ncbi:MAG: excinuclease ABC subunit UvrB [Christensenellaceae bacterium]|jgi:excinuclease ABC subunit B|nr:excinuclease ABC subunit UvrB [Christensenellaceae bacterium]
MDFELKTEFTASGSQPSAIEKLSAGILRGEKHQVLLGVTGSGKTFTMANIIKNCGRPVLVIAHNKTLAAQLCNEFRKLFPNNRVEYFVSYYDYYQPEAYLPATDTYIEKDMAINDEIDRLRNSATSALYERRDVIIVASVSCIYGLGEPEEYFNLRISLRRGENFSRKKLIKKLIEIQYKRADGESGGKIDFERGTFRVMGEFVDVIPAYSNSVGVRVVFFGDEVEGIFEIDALTGAKLNALSHIAIFPASHYAVGSEKLHTAIEKIEKDLRLQREFFEREGKQIEAHRITQRTNYDIEMLKEIGFVKGIENYSRYFDGRKAGEPPFTLMSYFPKDYLCFIDESHITIPQIRGMYNGDRARKSNLVDFAFRLPSAFDNRPLKFDEFNKYLNQVIYVSATPEEYEREKAGSENIVEQIIRPTGLLDPEILVKGKEEQIKDALGEIKKTVETGRVLITTLTKKMAEDLTAYLTEHGVKVRYLHSEIDTLDRVDILTAFRKGEFDVIVGINLLREGLDLPEVELVIILDADKEGLFRSARSLIQTIGRAARNVKARVIMYANKVTPSMQTAIDETDRRRKLQMEYNRLHKIIPKTVVSEIQNSIYVRESVTMGKDELRALMNDAAKRLDFEMAIKYREQLSKLK